MMRQCQIAFCVMAALAMGLAGCQDNDSSSDQSGTHEALVMNDTAESIQIEYNKNGVVVLYTQTSTINSRGSKYIDLWFDASGLGRVTVTQGNSRKTFRRPVEHPVFAISQDNMK